MSVLRQTDVLVVGGGLSGLRLADLLAQAGRDFCLVDRRDRFGGRIKTHQDKNAFFDLGPAWFWAGQPRMADLVARFGLPVFEQFSQGDVRFETADGQIQQGRGVGAMQGSYRLEGGMSRLTTALEAELPPDALARGQAVTALTRSGRTLSARLADGNSISAQHIVLAMPPRLAATLDFSPALPADAQGALAEIPTWMAGQAKALALYDQPFWRNAGLSGDAMSHRGPMVELHDASPAQGGPYALFGFIGAPPAARTDPDRLNAALRAQLVCLFGPEAAHPRALIVKDWAFDIATATPADHAPLRAHPRYGMPPALRTLWDCQLTFAGSEVARDFGGFLEGALEAAETAFDSLHLTPATTGT